MPKGVRFVSLILLLTMMAGCVYAPRQSEAPSDVPAQSSADIPTQSVLPSQTAKPIESWKDEVQLTSKSKPNVQRPAPDYMTKLVEDETHIYYVTLEGVKRMVKGEQKGELLYESTTVRRIGLTSEGLLIWEMETTGKNATEQTGTLSVIASRDEKLYALGSFDGGAIYSQFYRLPEECVYHNGNLFFFNGQIMFSIYNIFGDSEPASWYAVYDYWQPQYCFLDDKMYFIDFEYDENYYALVEADVLTGEHRKVWTSNDSIGNYLHLANIAIYDGKLFAAFSHMEGAGASGMHLVQIDIKTGEISAPLAQINSITGELDFVVEASGLYFGATPNQSYEVYAYDQASNKVSQIHTFTEAKGSFRIIEDTIFYGSDQGVQHTPMEG